MGERIAEHFGSVSPDAMNGVQPSRVSLTLLRANVVVGCFFYAIGYNVTQRTFNRRALPAGSIDHVNDILKDAPLIRRTIAFEDRLGFFPTIRIGHVNLARPITPNGTGGFDG